VSEATVHTFVCHGRHTAASTPATVLIAVMSSTLSTETDRPVSAAQSLVVSSSTSDLSLFFLMPIVNKFITLHLELSSD